MTDHDVIASAVAWCRALQTPTTRLVMDSRLVKPGDIFVAMPGLTVDGRDFIQVAQAKGAVGVLLEAQGREPWVGTLPSFAVPELSRLAGAIASQVYGNDQHDWLGVAVTGTNGKTTTTFWVKSLLQSLGHKAGLIGTTGAYVGEDKMDMPALTTPDALAMQALLAQMAQRGAAAFAVEASSIGLMTHRLAGTPFKVGVFTNLTRDHLDYHGDMQAYLDAKLRLMDWPGLEVAVINADDPAAQTFADRAHAAGVPHIVAITKDRRTLRHAHTIWSVRPTLHAQGQSIFGDITSTAGMFDPIRFRMELKAWGGFNVDNAIEAMASVLHGLSQPGDLDMELLERAVEVMQTVVPPNGRMQTFGGQDNLPLVVVDYAHTDDALKQVLTTLREVAEHRGGSLSVVFGCGGDRDGGKRHLMGEVASRLADSVYLTDDNPRTEDPAKIMRDIVAGAPFAQVIHDRAQGIERAVLQANARDVILVAGKGHETYQIVGHTKHAYSDQETVKAALNTRFCQWQAIGSVRDLIQDAGVIEIVGELPETVRQVSTDTRTLEAGDAFVALVGERFDGHDMVQQAMDKGASMVVVHRKQDLPITQVVVKDTLLAYQGIATRWRQAWEKGGDKTVIAVVGSNGKTTTKAWLGDVFKAAIGDKHVLVSSGNLNNQVGVAKMLLQLGSQHRVAILEAGISDVGEMQRLAGMIAPHYSIITNAHKEHQAFLKTVQTSARENGLVMAAMRKPAVVWVPYPDQGVPVWQQQAQTYGVNLKVVGQRHEGVLALEATPTGFAIEGLGEFAFTVTGEHFMRNAALVAGCAISAGVPAATVSRVLANVTPLAGRGQMIERNGVRLIDDAYNANPDSMAASLSRLAAMPGKRIFIMGNMAEVGDDVLTEHAQVGRLARELGVELWTIGEYAKEAAHAYGAGARHFDSIQDLCGAMLKVKDAVMLIKASHSSGLFKLGAAWYQLRT